MIVYLITTTLLSILGWTLYVLLVREKYSSGQQKNFILIIILLSFLFPLIFYPKSSKILKPNPLVQPLAFGHSINHHDLQSFCKCQNPDYTHRLKYRTNAHLNFVLKNKFYLDVMIGLAIASVIFIFSIQLLFLQRLVKRSQKKRIYFAGDEIILLFPPKPYSIGAFRLGKKYVIWQKELEALSREEREAILGHEFSHIRQKDTLLKAFLRVAQCFWLFNPVFYYFKKELDLLSECIADEAGMKAMSDPLSYAKLLVRIKEWQQAPLANQLKGSILYQRIHRLSHRPIPYKIKNYFFSAALLIFLQGSISIPLERQVSSWFQAFETYEEIYQKVHTQDTEAIYCQDCETVCLPVK